MKKSIQLYLTFFFLLLYTLPLTAASLTGTVLDKTNNEAIPYATVQVIHSATKATHHLYTDDKGRFHFKNLAAGTYTLNISFVGYSTLTQSNVELKANDSKTTLNTLFLEIKAHALNDVKVTSTTATLSRKIDKQVYKASDFSTAKGGTASDLISKLPGVSIDPDGSVSLRGSSEFVVYLNGKPTQIEPSLLLGQLSADQIQNIEVISVPDASYDAQGKGGIINITTKKRAEAGFSMSVNGLAGGAPWANKSDLYSQHRMNDDRAGGGINLFYVKDKISLFGGVNFNSRHVNGSRDGDARIRVNDDVYRHMVADGERPEMYNYTSANAGFDYQMSGNSVLSASYLFSKRKDARSAYYIYHIFYADKDKNSVAGVDPREKWVYNPNSDSRDASFQTANIDFKHTFSKSSDLSVSLLYENTSLSRELSNANFRYDPIYNTTHEQQMGFNQSEETPLEGGRISIDYTRKINPQHKIGIGLQPQYFTISGNFHHDTLDVATGQFSPKKAFENGTDMHRGIYAAYINYTGTAGNLSIVAGLRGEYTDQQIVILSPDYISLFDGTKSSRYTVNKPDLFHNVQLSYRFNDKNKMGFATSRRINRPSLKNMSPYLYQRHLEVFEVGDPQLKAEYLNNAELSYDRNLGKQSIGITAYYRGVENAVFRVNTVTNENPKVLDLIKEEVLIRSYTNAGNTHSLGVEVNANLEFSPHFKAFAGASVYNYKVDGDIFGYKVDKNSTNWSAKYNLNYLINSEWKLSNDFNLKSASITAQGKNDLFYSANAAISYAPAKWKGFEASIRALDFLGSNVEGLDTQAFNKAGKEIFYQETTYYRNGPIFELGISYIFNTKAKPKKAVDSPISNDQF